MVILWWFLGGVMVIFWWCWRGRSEVEVVLMVFEEWDVRIVVLRWWTVPEWRL